MDIRELECLKAQVCSTSTFVTLSDIGTLAPVFSPFSNFVPKIWILMWSYTIILIKLCLVSFGLYF